MKSHFHWTFQRGSRQNRARRRVIRRVGILFLYCQNHDYMDFGISRISAPRNTKARSAEKRTERMERNTTPPHHSSVVGVCAPLSPFLRYSALQGFLSYQRSVGGCHLLADFCLIIPPHYFFFPTVCFKQRIALS